MEVKFITEVTHSAEMLARSEADPLVKNLISLYKEGQQELIIGKRFDEVYDVDTLEPTRKGWQPIRVCTKKYPTWEFLFSNTDFRNIHMASLIEVII